VLPFRLSYESRGSTEAVDAASPPWVLSGWELRLCLLEALLMLVIEKLCDGLAGTLHRAYRGLRG